jgi:hypothetical protein
MKTSEIYNLAMATLLNMMEMEKKHLKEYPDSEIAKSRLNKYSDNVIELHNLILVAERMERVVSYELKND